MIENGKSTILKSFDVKKINISVQTSFDVDYYKKQYPHCFKAKVILKRLSQSDLKTYRNGNELIDSTSKVTENKLTTNRTNSKRKGDPDSIGVLTRSKRRKLDEVTSKLTTPITAAVHQKCENSTNDDSNVQRTKKDTQKRANKATNSISCSNESKRRKVDEISTPEVKLAAFDSESLEKSSKVIGDNAKPETTIAKFQFSVDDVVWGKIRGWAHWPAKIIRIENTLLNGSMTIERRSYSDHKSMVFMSTFHYSLKNLIL